MTAKLDVINALRSPYTMFINFQIENIVIRGSDYNHILNLITDKNPRIFVVTGRQFMNDLRAGAEYHTFGNSFVFPQDSAEGGDVIHEATHAIMDVRRYSRIRLHNEAAAYIAGSLYRRYVRGRRLQLIPYYDENSPGNIHVAADIIAAELYADSRAPIDKNQLENLYNEIRADPLYINDLKYEILNNG